MYVPLNPEAPPEVPTESDSEVPPKNKWELINSRLITYFLFLPMRLGFILSQTINHII